MYELVSATSAKHIESGTVFPLPPVETFGFEYQRWIDGGGVPDPIPEPVVVVPIEVTQRQARMALHALGHLTSVEMAINALPDPPRTEARIAWDFSNTIQRSNPFVSQLAALLGFTEQDLDELFVMAAGL